jgi:hypothetical protein
MNHGCPQTKGSNCVNGNQINNAKVSPLTGAGWLIFLVLLVSSNYLRGALTDRLELKDARTQISAALILEPQGAGRATAIKVKSQIVE